MKNKKFKSWLGKDISRERIKRRIIKEIEKTIWILILIFGIGFIIYGTQGFYIGFHNVDLSYNILRMSYYNDLNFNEMIDRYDIEGNTMDYTTAYIIGNEQMERALFMVLIGGFFFGSALMYLLGLLEQKEKRK